MEYSKEFVTAVVLGKDLVPRQVEKWLNFLRNICSFKPKSPFSYQKHLNFVSSFLIYPSLCASDLSSHLPTSFTWTPLLVFHTPFYRHFPPCLCERKG